MTVTSSIVNALLSAINTAVSDVDSVSSSDFTPAITTARIAALSPCLLYTSPSPRDRTRSRMPSYA